MILRTKRLNLRPVHLEDTAEFESFYSDERVMAIRKYGVMNRCAAKAKVQEMLAHWDRYGFGMFVITDRSTDAFAGECGLRWLEDGTAVELSYGLYPPYRGQGLATQAARAVVDYGIESLNLMCIVALSRGDNSASHRVLEKLGMKLQWRDATPPYGLVKYQLSTEDAPSSKQRGGIVRGN